jgi:hypothetical protein
MAQDFERVAASSISNTQTPAGATTLWTSDSDDALIGINAANKGTSQILVTFLVTDADNTPFYYILKDAPVPVGSALQVLDGGAKVVLQSGDILKAYADTASACDVWISVVDTISS